MRASTLERATRTRWLLAAAGAASLVYLYRVDPHQGGYLPCPTFTLTGTYCPGCGGLRAAYSLLHGDLAGSLARNPAVLVIAAVAAVWLPLWLVRGRPPVRVDPRGWRFWSVLGLVFVYWIARNIPGWDWLSPA